MSRASNAAGPRQDASARRGSKLGILRGLFVLPDFQGRKPFLVRRAVARAAMVPLVLAAVVGLGVLAPSASATKYVSSFIGNPGSTGGLFNNPRGVAVHNGSGGLYVVDAGHNRIQQFDAAGTFVRTWGADVDTAGGADFEICETAAACKSGLAGVEGGMLNLSTLGGVAVNQTSGDVYVTDANNLRVQQFTASGQFIRAWGQDVIVNTGTPANSNGTGFEICDTTTVVPNAPEDCKAGIVASTGGAFGTTADSALVFDGAPAVVPPGAPNAGNVLVADPGNRRVQEFTAAGGFVRAFGYDVQEPADGPTLEVCATVATCKAGAAGGIDAGRFGQGEPKRVAADATGGIYTVESSFAGGNFRVQKFVTQAAPPGLGASVFAPAVLSDTGNGFAPIEIAVDPADGRVVVVKGNHPGVSTCSNGAPSILLERRIYELSSSGTLLDTHLTCSGFNNTRSIYGLAISGDRLLFSSTYNGVSGQATHRVYVADADGITPAVATVDAVTGITATTAQIAATVNSNSIDNAFAPTRWKVQVSSNGSDWSTVAASSQPHLPAGIADVSVSASVDNLLPNTGYRVRVLTEKPFANPEVSSPEVSFLTDAVKPEVAAVKADMVDLSSARLTGQVNPHSTETSYRFEWGQDSFDQVVPVPDGPVGSGPSSRFVSEQLLGLQPDTTYQFRLVATSQTQGATTSATETFTTAAAATDDLAREFELVSPVDKVGGTGVGRWYFGPGSMAGSGFAAWEGERFAAMGEFGSVLRADGAFSFANDWALADRVSDSAGWQSHSPITHPSRQAQHTSFLQLSAVSEDLSAFFWRTNSTLRLFDELEPGWARFDAGYLSDWGAPPAAPTRWELFGPDDLSKVDEPAAAASQLWDAVKLSADGSTAVGLTSLGPVVPRLPIVHGLAGPGDPTARSFGDLMSGRSIYLADLAGGLTDQFAIGDRKLLNVCTGALGVDRTVLPAVAGAGDLDAQECPAAAAGRDARLVSDHGASLKAVAVLGSGGVAGTVSEDGSRVFFMAPDPAATGVPNGTNTFCSGTGGGTLCPPQLFVRQQTPDGDVVRWISRAQDGLFGSQDASLTGGVRFEGATPDGDKVFFRTNSPLTADDPNGTGAPLPGGVTTGNASNSSWDLYMYDLPDDPAADPADGQLIRISAGPGGDGDCNSPLPSLGPGQLDNGMIGALRAKSRDGRRVYFTCTAPLPRVDASADATRLTTPGGTTATLDQTNLYLYDANHPTAERWRFVARLPRVTSAPSGSVDACASAGTIPKSSFGTIDDPENIGFVGWQEANCVNATSDGAFVTFLTSGRLTLDDASSPSTGDIYGYDAESDELVRITASQGGVGGPEPCVTVAPTPLCWGTGSPESGPQVSDHGRVNTALGVAADPLVAGDRIAFFQSSSRLVPEDVDDGFDVYQWRNGDLSLVSTGTSDTDGALYKGNDRTGRNVYLVTQDRLSWQDTDSVADIYTARVGGGIDQPVLPPPCGVLAGVCQAAGPVVAAVPPRASQQPGGGNATVGKRGKLSLGVLSLAQRRKAARSGVLTLRVRTSSAGVIRVGAKANIGRKTVRVGSARERVADAGVARVVLRLSKTARKALGRGRGLRVALRVAQSGAATRTATVRLPGASS